MSSGPTTQSISLTQFAARLLSPLQAASWESCFLSELSAPALSRDVLVGTSLVGSSEGFNLVGQKGKVK